MLDFWVQFGLKIPLMILYCGVNFVKKYRWCHVGVQFLAKNCIDVTLLVKILPEKNCIVIVVLLRTHIAILCLWVLFGPDWSHIVDISTIWPCGTISSISSGMAAQDPAWSKIVQIYLVWFCLVLYGPVWSCMVQLSSWCRSQLNIIVPIGPVSSWLVLYTLDWSL